MKKHYAKSYNEIPKGWTIVRVEEYTMHNGKPLKGPAMKGFFALNKSTGTRLSHFNSYAEALASIPKGTYAEPWGV